MYRLLLEPSSSLLPDGSPVRDAAPRLGVCRAALTRPRRRPELAALAIAARVAGGLVAAGYLFGLVGGPVFSLFAGFFLAGFGRSLHLEPDRLVRGGLGLGILTAALTIGAARWGSPDLDHIRGAQAVLGPALLVGPLQIGMANASLAAASVLAGMVWLGSLPGISRWGWAGYALEVVLVAGTLLTVFWWPAAHSQSFATGRLASVIVAAALGAALVVLGFWTQRSQRLGRGFLWTAGALLVAGVWFAGGPA